MALTRSFGGGKALHVAKMSDARITPERRTVAQERASAEGFTERVIIEASIAPLEEI